MKDDLLYFSNTVCSIPLNALTIQRLIYLDSYLLQEEFTDPNSFIMQDLLINAKKNYVNIVLQNLSKAIQTNCGNSIDLDNVSIPENFRYSFTPNNNEKSISKIYKEYEISPTQQEQFKIIWLKSFIQELKKIDFSIRCILQLPQKDYSKLKPVNVFELIEEYKVFTSKFQQRIEKEFLKDISKSDKLNFYFNKMLPDYIEKTDSYFSHFEEMRTSFKSQFGYLNNYYDSLNDLISNAQIKEIDKIERFFNKVDYNDFEHLKNRFLSVISRIKSNQKLQHKEISNFLDELNFRISNMSVVKTSPPQQTEKPKPEQEQPETLGSIITHKETETLVSGIKTQYKNIKGKRLKLLLIALQELELLPKERIAKKFHTLCNNEFNWEIASYNAMNGYNFNSHTDTDEVEEMKQYIKTLLNIK